MALFSLSRVARQALASRGDEGSRRVLALLSTPRRLIVTIIVCNEVICIGAASIAAAVVKQVWPQRHEWVMVTIAATLTLPVLMLFGEMVPKSIAVRLGERWARAVSRPLGWIALLITPVRAILQLLTWALEILVGGKTSAPEKGVREAEFRSLVDVGSEEGELEIAERRLIHNVFEFGDTTVGKIMTPADKVFALPYEMPLGRLVEAVTQERYSRVPIYRTQPGAIRGKKTAPLDVIGILLAKDLVGYHYTHLEGHTVQDLLHPVMFVPRTTKCDQLFREFQRKRTHIALVVDEYGRLAGLVTMEDLLEELFGEISDEKETRS